MRKKLSLLLFVMIGSMHMLYAVVGPNNALDFDGNNDYVTVSNPMASSVSNFTVETWLYARGSFTYNALINGTGWDSGSVHFQIGSDGKLQLAINGVAPQWPQSMTVLQFDRWYHVAVTYDKGTQTVKFYINGVLDNTVTLTSAPSVNLTACAIGGWESSPGAYSRFFNGKMDDLRVWNTTRSLSEISGNYYKSLIGNEAGLIAYYPFDENGGSNLPDLAGGDQNGTLINFAWMGSTSNWIPSTAKAPVLASASQISSSGFTLHWGAITNVLRYRLDVSDRADFSNLLINNQDVGNGSSAIVALGLSSGTVYYCRIRAEFADFTTSSSEVLMLQRASSMVAPGKALDFDGVNDYAKIATPIKNALTNFTIETWLYARNSFLYSGLLNGDGWADGTVHFQIASDGRIQLAINGVSPQWPQSKTSIRPDCWYHVAVTYDKAAETVKFYIDGVLDNTVQLTAAPLVNLTTSTVGAWEASSGSFSRFFNGRLDEMRIWSTTRTSEEISVNRCKQFQGNENGLIAYYNFNHSVGTALSDIAGSDQEGLLNNFLLSGTSSNWVSSTAMAPQIGSPTHLSVDGFTAHWSAFPEVTGYRLDISDRSDFSTLLVDNLSVGNGTSAVVPFVMNSAHTYYCRIRAEVGPWVSPSSSVKSFALIPEVTAPGNALLFDGVDDYVDVNSSPLTQFTIEMWVNTTQSHTSTSTFDFTKQLILVDARSAPGGDFKSRDFLIALDQGHVRFYSRNMNTMASFISSRVINDGKWHHLAITYGNALANLYIDGKSENQWNVNPDEPLDVRPIRLGQMQYSTLPSLSYRGWMDEVRLWNRKLTLGEVKAGLYRHIYPGEEGLVLNCSANAVTGNQLSNHVFGMMTPGVLANFNHSAVSGWGESYAMGVPLPQAATDITSSSFNLHWEAPSMEGVEKYLLQLSLNPEFEPVLRTVDCGTALSSAVNALSPNTPHYYRIQAKRSGASFEEAYSPVRSVTTLSITSVEGLDALSLNVYPNPMQDRLMIDDPNAQHVVIMDLTGKVCLLALLSPTHTVDVSALPQGAYIVKILRADGKTWVRRVIKA